MELVVLSIQHVREQCCTRDMVEMVIIQDAKTHFIGIFAKELRRSSGFLGKFY